MIAVRGIEGWMNELTTRIGILHLLRWSKPGSPHQRLYATAYTISRDTCRSLLIPGITYGCHFIAMGTHAIHQAECSTTTLPHGRLSSTSRTSSLALAPQ